LVACKLQITFSIHFHDAHEDVAAALQTTPFAHTVQLVARDTALSWSARGVLTLAGPSETSDTSALVESPVLRLLRANGTDKSSAWDVVYRGGSSNGELSFEYRKQTADPPAKDLPSDGGAFALDTRAPPGSLKVDSDGATVLSQAHASVSPVVRFRRAQGAVSLPRVLHSGDVLGTISFEGFDGQNHHAAATIHV
jgi:hypothetical protein